MTETAEWVKAHPGMEVRFEFDIFENCLIITMFHRKTLLKCRKWITRLEESFVKMILDQMYEEIMDIVKEQIDEKLHTEHI